MRKLVVLGLVGLVAQLVDGGLGMGYGVTSSTLLVLAGLTPLAASASVHLSELATNLASGVTHSRLQNVDWRVVLRIAGPGAVGAFLGATVLSAVTTDWAKPIMSVVLGALGLYIIVRFVIGIRPQLKKQLTIKFLAPLGLFAGFVDATGGGGWGPVATPALLSGGRLEPRKVVGSVDTAEFAVSAAASLGFLMGIGASGIHLCNGPAGRRSDRCSPGRLPGQDRACPPPWRGGGRPDRADECAYAFGLIRSAQLGPDSDLCCDPACHRNGPLCGGPTRQAQGRSRPCESGTGSGQRLTT
jgi:uncharacterized membrane protein YfcA